MEKDARIYVAGHTGLVGSAFVRRLKELGYSNIIAIRSRELDLRRQSETEAFFKTHKPDYVFLAAAKVGGILANDTYKAEFIYDNLTIVTNVIHASYQVRVKKLLNLGSSCIYPKHAPQPMREEHLLTGELEPTNEPYAIAKIAAIKLCRYYNEQYGTNFMSVMPTNLYGPNDNFNLRNSHVLPAMIRKLHLAKLLSEHGIDGIRRDMVRFGEDAELRESDDQTLFEWLARSGIYSDKVVLWGSGKPFREFLHVDDMANGCVHLMENYDAKDVGEFTNIGTGKDVTIRELAEIISDTVGFQGKIEFDSDKPDGTPRKLLDVSKIKKMGWTPQIFLKDGIRKTYDWYLEQAQ